MMRAIALLMLAAAMLVAPLGARGGVAMAAVPTATHHGGAAEGHCAPDAPQPDDDRTQADCCAAMCSAVAPLPTAFTAPIELQSLPPVAAPAPLRAGIPAELPTPPPRVA